jgi:hypothetical protein
LEARQTRSFPLQWLEYFPQEAFQQLPDELVGQLIEASVAKQSALSDDLLDLAVERLAKPDPGEFLTRIDQLTVNYPNLAVAIFETLLDRKQVRPQVGRQLFPAILQPSAGAALVTGILDRLVTQPEFLRGEDLFALCLDNWAALREDMILWSWLRESRIEGRTLVGIADKWLNNTDKPHRIDILVIILRYVSQRSSRNWLTPPSLELQALCAAGRFAEAEVLADSYYDLSVKRQDARDYIRAARAQVTERKVAHEAEFERLWLLVNTIR